MDYVVFLVPVGLGSLGAYLLGTRRLGLDKRNLPAAVRKTLQCLGLVIVFLVVNVIGGLVTVIAARVVVGSGASFYLVNDLVMVALSFLQALVFQWWTTWGDSWTAVR